MISYLVNYVLKPVLHVNFNADILHKLTLHKPIT